jgi:hypothetical protein
MQARDWLCRGPLQTVSLSSMGRLGLARLQEPCT